jgi:hypothetical protein
MLKAGPGLDKRPDGPPGDDSTAITNHARLFLHEFTEGTNHSVYGLGINKLLLLEVATDIHRAWAPDSSRGADVGIMDHTNQSTRRV